MVWGYPAPVCSSQLLSPGHQRLSPDQPELQLLPRHPCMCWATAA
jgi:hypothetical protein